MPAFALDTFERQAEAFLLARARREWHYQSGARPGRGLFGLYQEDFPSFTSTELWADLQLATVEEPRHKRVLSGLLAAAHLEGRTREHAARAAGFSVRTTLRFEEQDLVWREAPARWPRMADVPRRHALYEAWRSARSAELNPTLARWHEALRLELARLTEKEWLPFWAEVRELDLSDVSRLANATLTLSEEVYGHALAVYLAQINLPIDDVWPADLDRAFRAPRFDATFSEPRRMPVLIRAFGELGIDLEEQVGVHIEPGPAPGVRCLPLDVPREVHVLLRLIGGHQDYERSLRGLGSAQHWAHTDASLPFWQRWLGDDTPTLGYGRLLESLMRERVWLAAHIDLAPSDDFRVISQLGRLYRLRRDAALSLYEQRLWQLEPGGALAADFEAALSAALRGRHFGEDYLGPLLDAPWSTLRNAVRLRAEVFAAQLRLYLAREFDVEWWRSPRAARFLVQELWRPGRRASAEELLGFMGYEGFDAGILWAEFAEVLSPL
ncbi:MAG: hypothetical protein M3336_15820 [Chloroflexota bacterium]|nr:hypothetical protein [Chloroflexota bacterium]